MLEAAHESRASVEAMHYPIGDTVERFRFGVALHVGRILYGNIGGGNRLDFTCIGPAVNLAARLEKIAGQTQRTIVASDGFAGICAGGWDDLGEFPIAGFAKAERVYGLLTRRRRTADSVPDGAQRSAMSRGWRCRSCSLVLCRHNAVTPVTLLLRLGGEQQRIALGAAGVGGARRLGLGDSLVNTATTQTPRRCAVIMTLWAWSSVMRNSAFSTVTTNSRGVKSSLTRMTLCSRGRSVLVLTLVFGLMTVSIMPTEPHANEPGRARRDQLSRHSERRGAMV